MCYIICQSVYGQGKLPTITESIHHTVRQDITSAGLFSNFMQPSHSKVFSDVNPTQCSLQQKGKAIARNTVIVAVLNGC